MAQDMPRRTGRPTLDEAAALKERILDKTMAAICESGSRGFSVDHVALLAEVSKRTIYRQFGSKAELIEAVVQRELERLRIGMVDPSFPNDTPMEALKACARKIFDKSLEPEAVAFANFISFEASQDGELRTRQQRWYGNVMRHIADMIQTAQDCGAMRAVDCRREALLLIDLINGSSHRKRYSLRDEDIFAGAERDAYFETRWTTFQMVTAQHHRS